MMNTPHWIRKTLLLCCVFFMLSTIFAVMENGATAATDRAFHFGFKKSKEGMGASIDEEGFKSLLEKYEAIFRGDREEKNLYLTFDNGYENGYTSKILDVLKAKKVPAIFFVTGHYVEDQPELIKRMAEEGHLIGNHSWSHPDMTRISNEAIRSELQRIDDQVKVLVPQQEMRFVRPPRGIFSERTLAVSREMGLTHVFWSVAYKDWDTERQQGSEHAYRQVIAQLHPGAVILLHAVSKDNAVAMARIIDEARNQGYTFRSLEDLTFWQEAPPGLK